MTDINKNILAATSLTELRDVLNNYRGDLEHAIAEVTDLNNLPKFGGSPAGYMGNAYSYSEAGLLIDAGEFYNNYEWAIVPRMELLRMRVVESIEMASNTDIYQVIYKESIRIEQDSSGLFKILLDGEEADYRDSYLDALEKAKTYVVDDHLIIKGHGTCSGRKFWQLPDSIREGVILNATKSIDPPSKEKPA